MLVDSIDFLRLGFVLYVVLVLTWFGFAVVKFPSWIREPIAKEFPIFALKFYLVGSAAVGLWMGFIYAVLHGFNQTLIGIISLIPLMGLYPFMTFVADSSLFKQKITRQEQLLKMIENALKKRVIDEDDIKQQIEIFQSTEKGSDERILNDDYLNFLKLLKSHDDRLLP